MTSLKPTATRLITALFWIFAMAAQTSGVEFIREHQSLREAASLHLNGFSYHKSSDRSELNQVNYGFGLGYYLGRLESNGNLLNNVKVSAEIECYSDSFSRLAYLCGITLQKSLIQHMDYGLNIGLIHENHLVDDIGLYLVPYLFPYLETRFDSTINARLTFVPPVANKGVLVLQLIARF
jgi:hypothetical protein